MEPAYFRETSLIYFQGSSYLLKPSLSFVTKLLQRFPHCYVQVAY